MSSFSPAPLPDEDARRLIRGELGDGLARTLFVEAGAGSGKTTALVDRVVALVDAGVELVDVAAITFTEKAATELRDRIRLACERHADDADPHRGARFRAAVTQIDAAAIGTLHAFAQRLLTEHPIEAELPPNVEVLDEVASGIEFEERWRRFRDGLLEAEGLGRTLMLADACGIALGDLRAMALAFGRDWDLVADPDRFPWEPDEPPRVDVDRVVTALQTVLDERDDCSAPGKDKFHAWLCDDLAPLVEQLCDPVDEGAALDLLRQVRGFRFGQKANWRDLAGTKDRLQAAVDEAARLAGDVAVTVLRRLALLVREQTLAAAAERRRSGQLEFHDLLVLARDVLRRDDAGEVRRALHERYRVLLLDEFQDTDPIQIELAVLLASSQADAHRRPWQDIEVDPGRLFFVGDPKQSIYRFRRADIALFLEARERFAGAEPVRLTTNFRSAPGLLAWVNHAFGQLIEHTPGAQPEYQPLDPAPERVDAPTGPVVGLLGVEPHLDRPQAEDLREREAADVADAVLQALGAAPGGDGPWQVRDPDAPGGWRSARPGDITILLPARTSLSALERALEQREIPYRAEASSLVYATREIRDLLTALRALADPSDQLALVAALRSPLFGCGDDDLVTYTRQFGGRLDLGARVPTEVPGDHPVAVAIGALRALADEVAWLSPSELLERLARERRLFELGHLLGHPQDLWRRLRFVIDQARAWSEAEGGTLRRYLAWARLQASESARVSETVLPETDQDAVRLMTVHASKGLQFPITVLSGTTTLPRGRRDRVGVAWPSDRPVALKVGKDVTTEEYEAFVPIDEQLGYHERLRLLYVACTRAQDHLVVSMHRTDRQVDTRPKATNAQLLAEVGRDAPCARPLDLVRGGHLVATGADEPGPAPVADLADWRSERDRHLAASRRPRSVGASGVEALALSAGIDEGLQKGPRDLDLPAWNKGRYGTAVGRAVHGVLQTVDLATGEGLEDAAQAQAAAEGVQDRVDDVVSLARAALGSQAMREAARGQRWRETYVATTIGDTTLEGYLDLLYRDAAGHLVVVDHKTASSARDLDERLERYRWQGGAYALAVEKAVGETVSRVVFLFLTPDGAIERDLDDVPGAAADVERLLLAHEPLPV
ncbi:MAG: UvrD-helicase domain-containing protein [Actinobacteria bacterium]|jgi:ATP-dependent exoDNAse (exonuclease V) beta subunit|nr:UvrD-helicase domain-containing protein [Actinomycetota bacterium]